MIVEGINKDETDYWTDAKGGDLKNGLQMTQKWFVVCGRSIGLNCKMRLLLSGDVTIFQAKTETSRTNGCLYYQIVETMRHIMMAWNRLEHQRDTS